MLPLPSSSVSPSTLPSPAQTGFEKWHGQRILTYLKMQVDFIKSQGWSSKRHNRRRDEFVMYVEAHAKMHNLITGGGGGSAN